MKGKSHLRNVFYEVSVISEMIGKQLLKNLFFYTVKKILFLINEVSGKLIFIIACKVNSKLNKILIKLLIQIY